jgi:hypothetical protein
MKMTFKEFEKIANYIIKNSDQGFIRVEMDASFPGVKFIFNNTLEEEIKITRPEKEEFFSKITKTERF